MNIFAAVLLITIKYGNERKGTEDIPRHADGKRGKRGAARI